MNTPGAAEPRFGMLRAIALYKLVKVIFFIATAYELVHLHHASTLAHVFKWIATLPSGLEREYVEKAVVWFSGLSDTRVEALRAASLLYAVLFSVEGVGLWMRRHWAEWLTVVSTGSLIPLEIWEFTQRPGIGKFSLTAVNVAIVAYLALRLRRERREAAAGRAAAPPDSKVK
jgi:uncharacterized membrane protein (DUF2068 family)